MIDYLRLPQTRLLQYQQYIKVQYVAMVLQFGSNYFRESFQELIKYTARAELSTESLQRALELMLSIPRRATDLNYIKSIQDFPGGDTGKLGRLLRHVSREHMHNSTGCHCTYLSYLSRNNFEYGKAINQATGTYVTSFYSNRNWCSLKDKTRRIRRIYQSLSTWLRFE